MQQEQNFLAEPSPSHAREPALLSCAGNRPHIALMAGSLLKRQRKAGVVDPVTGELVPFPYLSHPRAGLSNAQWRGPRRQVTSAT
jgi:hypothetical protein